MDFSKEFEILGKLDEDWRDHMASAGGAQPFTTEDAEKRQHFFDSLVSETSLQEHLMQQAELADLSPPALEAMRYLVGSLDDRGFLAQTPADIALQTGLPLEAVQEAVKLLKTFDPAGIGARSLEECLLIQLAAKGRERIAGRAHRARPLRPALPPPHPGDRAQARRTCRTTSRSPSRRSARSTRPRAGALPRTTTASSCPMSPSKRTATNG